MTYYRLMVPDRRSLTAGRGAIAKALSSLLFMLVLGTGGTAMAQEVRLIELSGAIGPASADFVNRSLNQAAEAGAALAILRIDTPGGLDQAMRDIIRAILASPVPVAGWVAPNGARAASAGTYIMYASHFAAMAPATNIGSSTPVSIGPGSSPLPTPASEPEGDEESEAEAPSQPGGGTALERKVINDAIAYLRSLAELRGRNADWAESTVREAANLTASQALEQGVIDFLAADIDTLLTQLDGRSTEIDGQVVTLALQDATVTEVEPDWRHRFLATITNPNVAYILLMIGIYGILFEFYNPGLGVPGIVGLICLLVGAFAMQMLPISYAGLALMVVGIGLMVTEALSPSFGAFGIGGLVAFVLGSIMLMDTELEAYQISMPIIAAFAVATGLLFVFAIGALLAARRQRVVSGGEALIGGTAEALEDFDHQGHVRIFGEAWSAISDTPVQKGSAVRVVARDGLTLIVTTDNAEPTLQPSPAPNPEGQ